jgi:hypothetical protein
MLRLVKVLGRVLVLGRVAAGRVSADEAHAQVNPAVARLHAIFANVFACFSDLDLVQVSAFLRHQFLLRIIAESLPASLLPGVRHELLTRLVSGFPLRHPDFAISLGV